MLTDIICTKCNGKGYTHHFELNRAWTEPCGMCNGTGKLGEIDMVAIPRHEYEELLEYKHMYEDLCK